MTMAMIFKQNFSMQSILLIFLALFVESACAKSPQEPVTTASTVYVNLQKLHSLKRVLYIAAHPDDENTRALAWFSLGEKAETAYLSLTRGDGGQNLIGDELSEELGVLRTQELLAARSFDGAKQYFTRAVDFGYSKSAKESLEKWGEEEMLSDVVLVIRQFKPDVIITRFPPDKRGGHGHHTASAMLAIEAFSKAADKNYLPEQVRRLGTWQTKSIYWNASSWWNDEIAELAKNNPNYLVQDIGGFNPLLGQSYNEIGTIARSQHKCQGFGAVVERGSQIEYFEHLAGEKLTGSFFGEKVETWTSRVNAAFAEKFDALMDNFDFVDLSNNVAVLLELRDDLLKLPASTFKDEKLARCQAIILDCLGLYADMKSDDYAYVYDETIKAQLNIINRSPKKVELIAVNSGTKQNPVNIDLPQNEMVQRDIEIATVSALSNPYWLEQAFDNLFAVRDPKNLGKAEGDPLYHCSVRIAIEGKEMQVDLNLEHVWRDPSYGERRRMTISAPAFSANFEDNTAILKPTISKKIRVNLRSFKANVSDKITIQTPEGWTASPSTIPVEITNKNEEVWVTFELTASANSKQGALTLTNQAGEQLYNFTEIAYDHIPTQVIFRPSTLSCIKLDAKIKPGKVAYIKGVDDAVPLAIAQLGFDVTTFEVADLATIDLASYQSVVLGIRIYNVFPELKNYDAKFFEYVANGGNLIMQYNTASRRATNSNFGGPIPFELSRNRVTEEDAEVTFLSPKHPLLNKPNKITSADFENWVQERGLYFADNWDKQYQPLLSWHDEGEEPQKGALIVAKHGEGQFIYTGISFFRELPNGVEGAYRLFANLLSYPNE
jgi:LmbE family N-acetylglucosaminyl deacetylase